MADFRKCYYFGGGGDVESNICQKTNTLNRDDVKLVYKWSASKHKEDEIKPTYADAIKEPDVVVILSEGTEDDDEHDHSSKESESSYVSGEEEDDSVQDSTKQQNRSDTHDPLSSFRPFVPEETRQFKVDDMFVNFVQSFNEYCEKRTHLIFDGPTFFDESCFPHNMNLTEYVPVVVVAPKVVALEVKVPAQFEYCKFGWCSNTLYEYFEDPESFYNRDKVLLCNVEFLFNTLQCGSLFSLTLETCAREQLTEDNHGADRMLTWNDAVGSFISRHIANLKVVNVRASRMKSLSGRHSTSNFANVRSNSGTSFPKLYELSVIFWDSQRENGSEQSCFNDKWAPDWFPDAVDVYWISLMKSQIHGILTKLVWVSVANLDWNQIFQPIIDANAESLQFLHVIEASKFAEDDTKGDGASIAIAISSSSTVLSCAALKNLKNLREFSLRKMNCFLVDLKYLPRTLEQLSIDDVKIKSSELTNLTILPHLKVLRLAESCPHHGTAMPYGISNKSSFGVGQQVLKTFLNMRSLDELCIWGHRINTKIDNSGAFRNVFGRVTSFIRSNLFAKSEKVTPVTELHNEMTRPSQNSPMTQRFLKALERIGFVDQECIVIYKKPITNEKT